MQHVGGAERPIEDLVADMRTLGLALLDERSGEVVDLSSEEGLALARKHIGEMDDEGYRAFADEIAAMTIEGLSEEALSPLLSLAELHALDREPTAEERAEVALGMVEGLRAQGASEEEIEGFVAQFVTPFLEGKQGGAEVGGSRSGDRAGDRVGEREPGRHSPSSGSEARPLNRAERRARARAERRHRARERRERGREGARSPRGSSESAERREAGQRARERLLSDAEVEDLLGDLLGGLDD